MSVSSVLARFARAPRRGATDAACELCAAPARDGHRHVVDLERRLVCCACETCWRLFVQPRAGSRFRTIGQRILADPAHRVSGPDWASLGIPVRLAFVFRSSRSGRWIAAYPGPAGVTEAELPREGWAAVAQRLPLAARLDDDIEALLFHGDREAPSLECLLVPIDACYALAGALRRAWRGFDGGSEARRQVTDTLDRLRSSSVGLLRQVAPGGPA